MITIRCPKCGSSMVKRIHKKTGTEFWGCSLYPDCLGKIVPTGEGETPTIRRFNPGINGQQKYRFEGERNVD